MTSDARRCANALRILSIDAVEKANSGHPGAPMGLADIAEVLWRKYLRHDPRDPKWVDRDRFVLSNGHASMLLYSLLHLSGYDMPVEELQRFRQLDSRTPGHPEVGVTPGVETTTGPLGQGLANAIGMALAEKLLALRFNRPGHAVVDHRTYCFVGDGCLMEGISHEAASLAGTLRLPKLIVVYDDNGISIDGHVRGWFRDDTAARFRAYGWHVIDAVDGHDAQAIDAAFAAAVQQSGDADGRATLIVAKTQIGWGAPTKQGTHDVHGAPLGREEAAAARRHLEWPQGAFEIPESIRQAWDAREHGGRLQREWRQRFEAYRAAYPELAAELIRRGRAELPADFDALCSAAAAEAVGLKAAIATRKASQMVLDQLAPHLPEALGGSADLTASNLTNFKGCVSLNREPGGNYLSYGVREFGMAAIMNGLALHGGFIPYGGTFLTFSDYSRNALRMAALMHLRTIHVFTHDSIGLGEDGPTHQAVEHAASLRLIPNLDLWRPADLLETLIAWQSAFERSEGPSALLLSRQNLPSLEAHPRSLEAIRRGGYVLQECDEAQVTLLATGSEVSIAIETGRLLRQSGIETRLVSMPCTQRFDGQSVHYREQILRTDIPLVAIEAAHPDLWHKYVGRDGLVFGIASFGASAPGPVLYEHFGLTPARIAAAVREFLGGAARRAVRAEPALS